MSEHKERRSTLDLQRISLPCAGGSCPTVYRTNRGTLVVQGTPLSAEAAGLDLPEDEILVEIPEELLNAIVDRR